MEKVKLSVSEFVAVTNQTLEYAYPSVEIEGEVASFKVNQSKFVFFDLKDKEASVGCFMTVWQLRLPIEDGMKVIITATPKLTQWGKFSLTVKAIRPSGEGSIKKSFEMLRAKLESEGLFAEDRKRPLPVIPQHVAVISSTGAAGYADFIKILDDRWGGVKVDVAHVQVQGTEAPDQMIRALKYFNSREQLPEVIVIIRGGGSADDLSAFNDEPLVREIAASRVPTLVGVGHEIDVSLSDMAADVRAATPSNAAQILVPDRHEIIRSVRSQVRLLLPRVESAIQRQHEELGQTLQEVLLQIERRIDEHGEKIQGIRRLLAELDPKKVLGRGYALVRGRQAVGEKIEIETSKAIMKAEVTHVKSK
jgi:exodeoxyribonuclease VII large subunit